MTNTINSYLNFLDSDNIPTSNLFINGQRLMSDEDVLCIINEKVEIFDLYFDDNLKV